MELHNHSFQLVFYLNGKKVVENNPNPEWTLIYYLRNKLRLCGTKESCGEGGCGACTVMLSRFDHQTGKIKNLAINSCLTPLVSIHGCAIVTVEGIGNVRNGLHPVQERIAKSHGTQCGFCTPGFVMSMYSLLKSKDVAPTARDVEENFQGNLCRCTGYRPILHGFKTFCDVNDIEDIGSSGCGYKTSISNKKLIPTGMSNVLCDESEFNPYDPTLDLDFPSELMMNIQKEELVFRNDRMLWYRPVTLKRALELKSQYLEKAVFIAGNASLGNDAKFKGKIYPVYIHITEIPELNLIEIKNDEITIGSAVTFTKLEEFCNSQPKKSGDLVNIILEMLRSFAGCQIRNMATIGGHIIRANPQSHLNTILIATGSRVLLQDMEGSRVLKLNEEFLSTASQQSCLKEGEILKSIIIPLSKPNEFMWWAKQSRRKVHDPAIVNVCIKIAYDPETRTKITEAFLAFGGVGSGTKVATSASLYLVEKSMKSLDIKEIHNLLESDFEESIKTTEGMWAYKMSLVKSFFVKFHTALTDHLSTKENSLLPSPKICSTTSRASQFFEIRPNEQPLDDLVGRPFAHVSALKHATGEAIYTNDIPFEDWHLVGSFVYSTVAHAKLVSVDASTALELPGVVAFFDSKSLSKEQNEFGWNGDDEQVFATEKVTCVGQIIGFIVAHDQLTADQGARLVKVEYEEISPLILTIEDAIKHESYLDKFDFETGDVEQGFKESAHVLEGEMRVGGQEHFYMETQSCVIVPKEDDELEVFPSTQCVKAIYLHIAKCLGIPAHKITVRVKRVGGAFGGKESREIPLVLPTAFAAHQLRVPVRCVLNRHADMSTTGTRHPCLIRFKVGFDPNGKINAVEKYTYLNGGNTLDHSGSVLMYSMLTGDLAYNVPNWKMVGYACKTNLPSNTAFRGYGGPQACITLETIIDKVAEFLGNCPVEKIREMHLYNERDKTPFGHVLEYCTIRRCWEECLANSDFSARKIAVDQFNQENKWKKRGIAVTPTRHNIGVCYKTYNQAGALVMVYLDGSVSLSHGGVEMGQGIHTKMIQIASRVLEIPANRIYISESSSDKIPNPSGTSASLGSDLNGMAVLNACDKLKKRLDPIAKANPQGKWEDWVKKAHDEQINLAATGFYKMMDVHYDFETRTGNICNYLCFGVACSEVEIDCLTGDHTVLRTDIVMDVGESLNPAIDIGQIEGAFMQGYGLFTLEEHIYSPQGHLLTKGPGAYKIPTATDIPREFNISVLRGAPNPKAVYSSKAIGEAPLFLSASVFFAIKEAIRACRVEIGLSQVFQLDSPATVERIQLACGGEIVSSNLTQI